MARQRIMARSPYYVSYYESTTTNILKVEVKLYAWEGYVSSVPSSTIYTLEKTDKVTVGSTDWYNFEISELLKDYLPKVGNPVNAGATAMWGAVQISVYYSSSTVTSAVQTFAVFDGYIDFEEESQSLRATQSSGTWSYNYVTPSTVSPNFKLSLNNTIPFVYEGDKFSVFVPVYVDDTGSDRTVEFTAINNNTTTITLSPSDASSNIIQYASPGGTFIQNNGQGLKSNNETVNQYYDNVGCIPDHTNNSVGTQIWYINKFGAIDKITFYGLRNESFTTTKEEYKSNIVGLTSSGNWGYNNYQRQKSILNKKGSKKITLNTGWISEDNNEKMQDLFLAEQVWVRGTYVAPVNIVTSSLQNKTDANEKLVNYQVEFEYANDIQNNIR